MNLRFLREADSASSKKDLNDLVAVYTNKITQFRFEKAQLSGEPANDAKRIMLRDQILSQENEISVANRVYVTNTHSTDSTFSARVVKRKEFDKKTTIDKQQRKEQRTITQKRRREGNASRSEVVALTFMPTTAIVVLATGAALLHGSTETVTASPHVLAVAPPPAEAGFIQLDDEDDSDDAAAPLRDIFAVVDSAAVVHLQ